MEEKIKNIFGEKLDVLIEGNSKSNKALIFVHGFGTDKNEGFSFFLDLAEYLKDDFLTIRFDLSGYGKSEGKDYEFQFEKAARDVDVVIKYAREHFKESEIYIIAHSFGIFAVSLLSPSNIKKVVFTSIPNANIDFVIDELKKRITSKGGLVDENDLTVYPRTNGEVQTIGEEFWKTIRAINPCESIQELGSKTELVIFKPKEDDILENKYFEEYKKIKNIKYTEVNGDHNFTNESDRMSLFVSIKQFLLD
ncbi:MAG: alpha/beta fold hydrolase [Candidatus Paceibacterota bacterium]|jgi:hypothetical protein